MKRLGYPFFLVVISLTCAVVFTTFTAVTLESYSKGSKSETKVPVNVEGSTVVR